MTSKKGGYLGSKVALLRHSFSDESVAAGVDGAGHGCQGEFPRFRYLGV